MKLPRQRNYILSIIILVFLIYFFKEFPLWPTADTFVHTTVKQILTEKTVHEVLKPTPHTIGPLVESVGVCEKNFIICQDSFGCQKNRLTPTHGLTFSCHPPITITCEDSLQLARDKYYKHLMRDHCKCSRYKRLGRSEDGAWPVCMEEPFQLVKNNCLIYSFGIRDDWGFDDVVSTQYGCEVMAFDPSIGKGDHKHNDKVWFHNTGLGGKDENKNTKGWKMRTLMSAIKELGHANRTIDMVKFDIEFSEWAAIAAMLEEGALKWVKQIALEIHTWRDTVQDYVYFWRQLQGLENIGFQRWIHQHLNWRCFSSHVGKSKKSYCPQVNMNYINTNFISSEKRHS